MSSAWQLRQAEACDLSAIMQLEQATFVADAWPEHLMRDELKSSHSFYLVAVAAEDSSADTELAGYAGLRVLRGAPDADIQTIAVSENARRRGLGRHLMESLMAKAGASGARELFLEVRADNPAAQSLYRSLGFEQIAVREHYYQPDNVDAYIMRATVGAEPRQTREISDEPY